MLKYITAVIGTTVLPLGCTILGGLIGGFYDSMVIGIIGGYIVGRLLNWLLGFTKIGNEWQINAMR